MKYYLWKGDITKKCGTRINWTNVTLSRDEGGLGIKNSSDWNRAQLMVHLCHIIFDAPNLWAKWVNTTVPKRKYFWTMIEPTDCSWIWRKILQLRNVALQFLSYTVGDGRTISLWFDPWWNQSYLASNKFDNIITQVGLSTEAIVHDIINTGNWVLPIPNTHHHHVQHKFLDRIHNFSYPDFNLEQTDRIFWNGVDVKKVKAWHIWDATRFRLPITNSYKTGLVRD
ncbi:hypothetical protein POM88_053325 [Heracleum sosnowskyi]|uniref:Reverse transcriptase zinc-binding domain-containing protein n=1 Tax=Heracleum sosnowskyi TaxID=360622 RepID=A0AAD8GPS1_9APIA|nr:hypothetical protein POM88_053325 [Heracleum sosnowskyi]